jgi:hypothetical protein
MYLCLLPSFTTAKMDSEENMERIAKENIFGSEGFSIIEFCELYFLYYNHACGQ